MTSAPSAWKIWLTAARPRTLTACLAPIIIGLALAWGTYSTFDLINALATILGALCIQIGTNFFNDYADSRTGADDKNRLGPPRATSLGWVAPRAMLIATGVTFLIAILAGLVLIARCGQVFLWIGIISLICGIWYTSGRWSLAYLGLAEPFVLIFFGPVAVAGTVYAQIQDWIPSAFILGFGTGSISTILLVLNNMRDREGDAAANKKTLIVRFGKNFGIWEISLFAVIAAAAPLYVGLALSDKPAYLYALPAIYILFVAPFMIRSAHLARGRDYNTLMAKTGKLLLVYAVLALPALLTS